MTQFVPGQQPVTWPEQLHRFAGPHAPVNDPGAGVTQAFERPWNVPPPPPGMVGFATAPATGHRRPRKVWPWLVAGLAVLLALCGGLAALTALTGPGEDEIVRAPGASTEAQPEEGAAAPVAEEAAEPGSTRQTALKPGTSFLLPDWRVTVGKTVSGKPAERTIARENMFNAKPVKAHTFAMVPVSLERTGGEPTTPWVDIIVRFVTPDGLTIDASTDNSSCGVTPKDVSNIGEMFPGAKASGNACLQVPSAAVATGTWVVEPLFRTDRRVYIATK